MAAGDQHGSTAGSSRPQGAWRPGYRITVGDFDGDGRDEVFGAERRDRHLVPGAAGRPRRLHLPVGHDLHDGDVRVADFNGDARDDVFVYDAFTGRWTLMLSGDDGHVRVAETGAPAGT